MISCAISAPTALLTKQSLGFSWSKLSRFGCSQIFQMVYINRKHVQAAVASCYVNQLLLLMSKVMLTSGHQVLKSHVLTIDHPGLWVQVKFYTAVANAKIPGSELPSCTVAPPWPQLFSPRRNKHAGKLAAPCSPRLMFCNFIQSSGMWQLEELMNSGREWLLKQNLINLSMDNECLGIKCKILAWTAWWSLAATWEAAGCCFYTYPLWSVCKTTYTIARRWLHSYARLICTMHTKHSVWVPSNITECNIELAFMWNIKLCKHQLLLFFYSPDTLIW